MFNIMAMPAVRFPDTKIDVSPLDNAISGYAQAQDKRYLNDQRLENQAYERRIEGERLGREKESHDLQVRSARVKQLGGLMQAIDAEQDPTRRGTMWDQALRVDPRLAQSLPESARDPINGPRFIIAEARGYRDPLEEKLKTAQLTHAQGAESRAKALHPHELYAKWRANEASKIGTVKDDQRLYVVDPKSPDGVRFIEPPGGARETGSFEKKFGEAAAIKTADRYDETIKQGANQQQVISQVQALRQFSDRIGDPGITNTFVKKFGPYGRALGIDIPRLSAMEGFNALVSRLVPQQRPPGSGTMSDNDVDLFRESLPAIAATAQGRRFILDQMESIARYDVQRAQIASKVMNGEMPRQDGERLLRSMPDPMELFRRYRAENGQPPPAVPGAPAPTGGAPNGGFSIKRLD